MTVLTGWGVSVHLSQGHLQYSKGLDCLTPLSDLCLVLFWAPQALPVLASVCTNPKARFFQVWFIKKQWEIPMSHIQLPLKDCNNS